MERHLNKTCIKITSEVRNTTSLILTYSSSLMTSMMEPRSERQQPFPEAKRNNTSLPCRRTASSRHEDSKHSGLSFSPSDFKALYFSHRTLIITAHGLYTVTLLYHNDTLPSFHPHTSPQLVPRSPSTSLCLFKNHSGFHTMRQNTLYFSFYVFCLLLNDLKFHSFNLFPKCYNFIS